MALFLISCVALGNDEIGYRIMEHLSHETKIYREMDIVAGLNNGVKIENMYLQNGKVGLRGVGYRFKGLRDRSSAGDSVTVIAKDPVKKAYAVSDTLGRVSVVTKKNLLKLLKYNQVTDMTDVDGINVRALPGVSIPEQSLELLSEINARNTKIGVWALMNKRNSPVSAYYYDIAKNMMSYLSSGRLNINVNSGCREDSLEFSDELTPIRKDLVLGAKELEGWKQGILIKQTYVENKPGFVYCNIKKGSVGNASFVPLEEVVGSLLLKKGRTYYAKYGRNNNGDLAIETLVDGVVVPRVRVESLCRQYEIGYNNKVDTENILRIACSSDVRVDASGRLLEVKEIASGGSFVIPKGVSSIENRAFQNCKGRLSRLEILENVKMVYEGNKPAYLRLYMPIDEIVVSSPYILADLNRLFLSRTGGNLKIYGDLDKIGGWASVITRFDDVTINNLHFGDLPDNIQWNIVEDMKKATRYQKAKDSLLDIDEKYVWLKERKRKRGTITLRKSDVNAPDNIIEVEHIGKQMVYEVADVKKLDNLEFSYYSFKSAVKVIAENIEKCGLSAAVASRFEREYSEVTQRIEPIATRAKDITEGRVMYKLPWPNNQRVRQIAIYHKVDSSGEHSLNLLITNNDCTKLGIDLQNGKRMSYCVSSIKKFGVNHKSLIKVPVLSNVKSYNAMMNKLRMSCISSDFIGLQITYDEGQDKAIFVAEEVIKAIKSVDTSIDYTVTPKKDWLTNDIFMAFGGMSGNSIIQCSTIDSKIYLIMFTGVESRKEVG